nr:reverse transcriptase domain-containing protein [Tanacetum cinerariifolium]
VLLFNSRLKIFSDKLKSRWSGPFTISQVFPYGTVELSQPDVPNFKVNDHRLKHYFGEDVKDNKEKNKIRIKLDKIKNDPRKLVAAPDSLRGIIPIITYTRNYAGWKHPWGNKIDVVVLVDSIRAISERFVNIAYGFFLGKRVAYPVVANYVRNTWEECTKNIGLGVAKNVKKPSQTSRGFLVGLKVGFKPYKEYRPVPKNFTASSIGNKKKGVAHTNEVSNLNPFDVLNSVDNDVEFGTNRRTTNLVNNEANSSGSSFMNVEISSTGNNPIIDKIEKFEAILVDEASNSLKKVECSGDYDNEYEVASVDNDMARYLALERVGFGTQSLLEK